MDNKNKRIYLQSYDNKLLDQTSAKIVEVVKKNGSKIAGPMPLPTKTKKYTVLRSVHVNKDSREQFEMRIHRRFIEIKESNNDILTALSSISLPAGVSIEIKQ
ncbi:30S ribosomal protein S10 [Streptobacillus notomytis]|uniref:30S ribosomal protein S10 n=1 Tax=Streptobacillus notomytis TaxID=1712031 RepID=UPI0009370684|nr:30S ribosomal protein S10 [Streptobacillus notomytis]